MLCRAFKLALNHDSSVNYGKIERCATKIRKIQEIRGPKLSEFIAFEPKYIFSDQTVGAGILTSMAR